MKCRADEKPGTLLIRADASPAIGTGHVMRCLALAQRWHDAGGKSVFAMAASTPTIRARLAAECCTIASIPDAMGSMEDAACLADLASTHCSRCVVIDGYRFSSVYRRSIQQSGAMLLCIDDNGLTDELFADLVLNQNLHGCDTLYPCRKPETELLLGPKFVLLRREFDDWRNWKREVHPNAQRILVTMGGSDPANLTEIVLQALSELCLENVETVLVAGGSNPRIADLRDRAEQFHGRLRVEVNPINMAELMAWADLAISAAGATCWEMCMLGLPALVIDAGECQVPLARELDRAGVAVHVPRDQITVRKLTTKFQELIASGQLRSGLSRKASGLVDGCGAARVVEAMRLRVSKTLSSGVHIAS
jgi:UDP-2,4-diacetamido-2,4,6-trideoxy-beta-L-altropyranose hydrolase